MRRVRSMNLFVATLLCAMVMWTACSTAWIGEAEQIVAVLIPGIANLVTLVAVLPGSNVSAQDLQTVQSAGTQAEADLQLLQSLIAQHQKADAAARPGLLNQIQADVSMLQANLSGLIPALHIKDAATQAKVTAVVGLLLSEVQSIAAIVMPENTSAPSAATALTAGKAKKEAPLSAREFVIAYNATMRAKTGGGELDRSTAGLEIHLHGKFARWATAGILK